MPDLVAQLDPPAHHRGGGVARATLALAAIGLIAAGCSSSKKSSVVSAPAAQAPAATAAVPTTAAAAAPTTAAAPAGGTAVTATEKEFTIALSKTAFTPGTYTFTVDNAGKFKHNLVFNGPGVVNEKSALVLPGQTGTVTVALQAGTYDVYCGVPTHKAKGMDLHITVA
jgi:uncharacterized cupredoxin-like copper-binding protein